MLVNYFNLMRRKDRRVEGKEEGKMHNENQHFLNLRPVWLAVLGALRPHERQTSSDSK